MDQVRQGDVFIRRVAELPSGARKLKRDKGKVVLAYGEATGHAHAFGSRFVNMYAVADEFDRTACSWLRVMQDVVLRHEEHRSITLPPGNYRVVRQRQWEDAPILVAD